MEETCCENVNNVVVNLSTARASTTSSQVKNVIEANCDQNCYHSRHSALLEAESQNDNKLQDQVEFNAVLNHNGNTISAVETSIQSSISSISDDSTILGKLHLLREGSTKNVELDSVESFNYSAVKLYNAELTQTSKCETTSELTNEELENQTQGVIVSTGGANIYLETPLVEEQAFRNQLQITDKNNSIGNNFQNTAKPKRLNDEFFVDDGDLAKYVAHLKSPEKCSFETDHKSDILKHIAQMCKSDGKCNEKDDSHKEQQNGKNFDIKKNISNSAQESYFISDAPSSSHAAYAHTMSDIQSMDLIERRDFETEHRLINETLLKSSSLINKNLLNLNFVEACKQQRRNQIQQDKDKDDCSSDCVDQGMSSERKSPSTTPTSSRDYNSRIIKTAAKINFFPALSLKQKIMPKSSNTKLHTAQSSTTLIVEATTSSICNRPVLSTTVLYSSSNSNDSLTSERGCTNVANANIVTSRKVYSHNCHQEKQNQVNEFNRSDCSNALGNEGTDTGNYVIDDDPQPSTSSARCQYAPVLKNTRQVNASAQTNEKYLSRVASCSTSTSNFGGINLSINKLDRKDLTSHPDGVPEEVIPSFKDIANVSMAAGNKDQEEFCEDSWADCEETSDMEEICTCRHSTSSSSHGGSNCSLNETEDLDVLVNGKDFDLSSLIQVAPVSEDGTSHSHTFKLTTLLSNQKQRKRKYSDNQLINGDNLNIIHSGGSDVSSRKRIAYDCSVTPRSTHNLNAMMVASAAATPSCSMVLSSGSPNNRRTPRSVIPTRENPPPELQDWLLQFQRWSHAERLLAVDRLIEHCEPTQVRHMMKVIEPQFQRDFISLLPRELALQVLAYLEPMDLLRAAQTCRSWRFLCDDNLLWKEKCRKSQILNELRSDRPKRGRAGNMPHIASPWKAAYMRQHIIEMNWRSRAIRDPKILKGHDDHVITCLQFSGNRIVSGSDDNTLKVWSAVTGRCLRTLVGHTGGVWSSQMSGNIIISGSTDRTLKVWDMETGQCVHTLLGHTSTVRCMHLHGKRVVSGSRDATLRVWDIEQGTCLHVLVGHLAAVRCVQYDGKLIVSGAYDYMVKIWHPERQECLHTLQGHTNRVYSLQFDGIHVVSGSLDTSIRVWDVETGNCKHTLMGHQSLTSGMELRQNILVSGNADSTVKVWDITTGQCLQTLSGPNKHQSAVTCLQFNSRFVVTSSDDGTVKLWDVKTGEFIRNLVALDSGGSGGVVWRIRANDTKLICAVGSRNGTEETKLMVLDFDVEGACVKCS